MIPTVEIPRFIRWSKVPEHLKTKTQLKELGLKPLDESNFQATIKVRQNGATREFNLYDISLTRLIKRRITNIDDIEIKPETIAEALYVINKSAKKSRDTKEVNYDWGNHDIVSRAKIRQNSLYALKEEVLKKCIVNGFAEVMGYHTQKFESSQFEWVDTDEIVGCDWEYDDETESVVEVVYYRREQQEVREKKTSRLLLIKIADFSFHLPASKKQVKNFEYLGEIDKIPAEQTIKTKIKFEQAMKLLNKYLEDLKQHSNDFKSTE